MNVGQDRHADLGADFGQDFQAGFHSHPAKRLGGGAIGFVEAGLEDIEDAELGAGFLECGGNLQAELLAFNYARPGDQSQPAGRIERFPNGVVVEHTEVLAAKRRKVNGA